MNARKTIGKAFLGATFLAVAPLAAQAATVTFSNLADGNNAAAFFDIGTTVIDGDNIDIGINGFTANGSNQATLSALDTFSFTVKANPGFVITKVSYTESGSGQTTNGVALATGSITADGTPKNFLTQLFTPNTGLSNWSIGGSVDVANKQEIIVSIVNSLFAVTFGGLTDIATISKTGATLTIETIEAAPIPLPPAAWLLGSALVGLVTMGRRSLGR